MQIYLDICCFNRPFDDQTQLRVRLEAEARLALQERIRAGGLRLGWSYMMDFENEANPFEERKASIAAWRALATVDTTESEPILRKAKALHEAGFRNKDALHLACAIEVGCQAFITSDDGILGKKALVPEIAIRNPIDYATEDYDH